MKTPQGDYTNAPKRVSPGTFGGHNWQPSAFSPQTGLVYIPTIDSGAYFAVNPEYPGYVPGLMLNVGRGKDAEREALARDSVSIPWRGSLKAWDPIAQKEVWRVDYPFAYNGGLLATAGQLVFQGAADGYLNAYDAKSGKLLKALYTGIGIMAAPLSYSIDGTQYIAVMAGYGGAQLDEYLEGQAAREYANAGRILSFRLGGGAVPLPPEVDWDANSPPLPPRMAANAETVSLGLTLFRRHCRICHQPIDAPGGYPNLFRMAPEKHEIFADIVLRGVFSARGMASFSDALSETEAHAIHAWLIDKAYQFRARH